MKKIAGSIALILYFIPVYSQLVTALPSSGAFPVVDASGSATLFVDPNEDWLVQKSASLLQSDIEKITGKKPALVNELPGQSHNLIIIGSVESSIIKPLADVKNSGYQLEGKWETYMIRMVKDPLPGVKRAVLIAGSDKRGTAYGVMEMIRQMGVSPWYWWADVPVKQKKQLYIKSNIVLVDSPRVKYRGIFINDEAPALSGWAKQNFGGFNHGFYEKVFELMLRLKANYLWPAMWGNAFYDDDSLNRATADKYGIIIGTSHHEPLMRAHDEWRRYGKGKWNYDSNEVRLKQFWREGMQRVQGTETIVSVGMRGDGDEPMTRGTAIALLEKIVRDQRQIISEVTGKHASATPQLWALYKEVQDYYDKGMRVPDDITLLLCDDNWGNIRKLPRLSDPQRSGGYGIYYHFDYVGGPRNYKWINTNNIARVWEQMHLAWEYGVNRIWIVNVGDIKPMEFPISFFLDYAWDPLVWNPENLRSYFTKWSAEQFGNKYAKDIGEIIRLYSQFNARRKPELLSPDTYSLQHYSEADRIVKEYKQLAKKALAIEIQLPVEYRDAYFQLVLHPVLASANLNELYVAVAKNHELASKGNTLANKWAEEAQDLYRKDSLLTLRYNKETSNGKWHHMMDQTHIGYTYWQQPPRNRMPQVRFITANATAAIHTQTAKEAKPSKRYHPEPKRTASYRFVEQDGIVSMDADHFTYRTNKGNMNWKVIPDIGRTGSGVTIFPVTSPVQQPGGNSPHLVYEIYTYDTGTVHVQAYFSPTLNFHNDAGLHYAMSIDNETPVIINLNKEDTSQRKWEQWVANNIIIKSSTHRILAAGRHQVKFWMVDAGVVLQKIVLDFGGLESSYLGPPETLVK